MKQKYQQLRYYRMYKTVGAALQHVQNASSAVYSLYERALELDYKDIDSLGSQLSDVEELLKLVEEDYRSRFSASVAYNDQKEEK